MEFSVVRDAHVHVVGLHARVGATVLGFVSLMVATHAQKLLAAGSFECNRGFDVARNTSVASVLLVDSRLTFPGEMRRRGNFDLGWREVSVVVGGAGGVVMVGLSDAFGQRFLAWLDGRRTPRTCWRGDNCVHATRWRELAQRLKILFFGVFDEYVSVRILKVFFLLSAAIRASLQIHVSMRE